MSKIDLDYAFGQAKTSKEALCLLHNWMGECNTGLGATPSQKEGEVFKPVAFASKFLTDCENSTQLMN